MILIFRHVDCEGPGYLLDVLESYGLDYRLLSVDLGHPIPKDLSGISGLVFMGGSMSVNDDLPWIAQELELIQKAYSRDIPILGHCLGAQLMAKAMGGKVEANPVTEIGWFDVQSVPSDLSQYYPDDFTAFHWHGETFSLPEGSTLLYANAHCAHQGFALGNSIGLQFHIEMQQPMVEEWTTRFAEQLSTPATAVQSAAEINRHLQQRIDALHCAADQIYQHWLGKINQ